MIDWGMLLQRYNSVCIVTAIQEILRVLYLQLMVLTSEINGHVRRVGVTVTAGLITNVY
jgi:hypothetical protein